MYSDYKIYIFLKPERAFCVICKCNLNLANTLTLKAVNYTND